MIVSRLRYQINARSSSRTSGHALGAVWVGITWRWRAEKLYISPTATLSCSSRLRPFATRSSTPVPRGRRDPNDGRRIARPVAPRTTAPSAPDIDPHPPRPSRTPRGDGFPKGRCTAAQHVCSRRRRPRDDPGRSTSATVSCCRLTLLNLMVLGPLFACSRTPPASVSIASMRWDYATGYATKVSPV